MDHPNPHTIWQCRDRQVALSGTPVVMGILNITPDSFSDGGRFHAADAAAAHARRMVEEGARILDIGGESTRPGAEPVSADEEAARVLPVIRSLAKESGAIISIDTAKASVAGAALEAGACIVNDVSAGTADPAMLETVARYRAGMVLMHMQGTPRTMQADPRYGDVTGEVGAYLAARVEAAVKAGIDRSAIVADPGIGFGKTVEHNLTLLRELPRLAGLAGVPLLVGVSRKRFIGAVTGRGVDDRLAGSLAAMCFAITRGAAIIRVHDVKESCDAAVMMAKLFRAEDA